MEPSTISGFSAEGSALDAEPSMMQSVFVEGSVLENGTFHGFGPQRGWFRPTASRKHQRAGILPQVVVDRVCGQSARARLRTDACGQKTGQAMHLIACLRPKDGRGCKSPLQRPAASIK